MASRQIYFRKQIDEVLIKYLQTNNLKIGVVVNKAVEDYLNHL